MKTCLFLIMIVGLVSGCATNDFTKFYQDRTASVPKDVLNRQLQPYSGTTQVFSSNDIQKDGAELSRRGYVFLGESAFEGAGKATDGQLKEQAKTVGADIVLYRNQYEGAEQASMPQLEYHPGQNSTTYNSGTVNASAYGTGGSAYGSANYSGSSTTTSPGTFSTTMVPITLHRYAHNALYWRKGKAPVLGVQLDNLTDEMRLALKRNTGALVKIVMYDTPAFKANMFPGDIIISIDDTPIDSAQDFMAKVGDFAGKECKITVLREGKETPLKVKMNPKAL
jgi:hypothetical protein